MYVHSVKLVNFKSFGNYKESEVILEPRITAIIGKNESGKSNVLDGLSRIYFITSMSGVYSAENKNRRCQAKDKIEFRIILKPTPEDIEKGITGESEIDLEQGHYTASGTLVKYYGQTVKPYVDKVLELLAPLESNVLRLGQTDLKNLSSYISELNNTTHMSIPMRDAALNFLFEKEKNILLDIKDNYNIAIEEAMKAWKKYKLILPVFFYRNSNKHLNTVYRVEDVEKELVSSNANPNSLLYDFVQLLGVNSSDFIAATHSGTAANQATYRKRIEKAVKERINDKFHEFYQTEEISLGVDFNNNAVYFTVQSNDGDALMLSERSNGLRWYLETFIDAQANNISNRNVVYLLDEPGVYLHVNAQKELLNLFNKLADLGNQVVYTTHSPYMLDIEKEGIHRIRAVVKDSEGNSYIYKNAYDAHIAPESQQDTLAPIINAIGMNLNDTFGPANNKFNIVTEGISDYIYLTMAAKILNLDTEKYAIIPAVGAANCINICAILHGWGCKYIALFDYDKAGVESGGEYLHREMLFELGKQYCYIADITQEDVDKKTYKHSRYMIEDIVTQTEIDRFCSSFNVSPDVGKPLKAKLISNAVEDGTFVLGEQCMENFKNLFDRIVSYSR